MAAAHVPNKFCFQIFPLVMEIACAVDWLLVIERNGAKKPKILFLGDKLPCFVPYMRTFGEAGVVIIKGVMHLKPHN